VHNLGQGERHQPGSGIFLGALWVLPSSPQVCDPASANSSGVSLSFSLVYTFLNVILLFKQGYVALLAQVFPLIGGDFKPRKNSLDYRFVFKNVNVHFIPWDSILLFAIFCLCVPHLAPFDGMTGIVPHNLLNLLPHQTPSGPFRSSHHLPK
jgi:hypothetical protein